MSAHGRLGQPQRPRCPKQGAFGDDGMKAADVVEGGLHIHYFISKYEIQAIYNLIPIPDSLFIANGQAAQT